MLQKKKWWRKIFKIAAIGIVTSLIMSIFLKKKMRKMDKISFSSKINLVTAGKKDFQGLFQLLKVKITYKLNIYRLIY